MTCHHGPNDRSCSSHRDYVAPHSYANSYSTPITPDSEKYEIIDYWEIGEYFVLKVKYPNCGICSFEGTKILVYHGISVKDILTKWKKIDPHFADPKRPKSISSAPPPIARFPASAEGQALAIKTAEMWHRDGIKPV